jgi:predicted DNA-binding transcriptional regulator YafY
MSQRQQLERIMAIDRSIRDEEYPNADCLAQKLEVSRRVIFNDREFMINRLGAPIEFDHSRGGWYYTDKTWVLPGMIVTEGELLAFFLSVEISKRFLGSSLESPLRSAVEKILVKGPVTVTWRRALALHFHPAHLTNEKSCSTSSIPSSLLLCVDALFYSRVVNTTPR